MEEKKFSWKEVVNPKTLIKFKAIREKYNYWDKENKDISRGLETGFCIDKKGKLFPNDYYDKKDLIWGTDNSIKLSAACKFGTTQDSIFGEKRWGADEGYDYNPKYAIHSHGGFPDASHILFTNRFSPEDLIQANSYGHNPCIVWREETYEETPSSKKKNLGYSDKKKPYDNWYIKCHSNVPKDRMDVIRDYGRKFDYFKKKESRIKKQYKGGDILKLDRDEYNNYHKEIDNLHNFMKKVLDQYEKKTGVKTKKLFKYWYKGYD